jgi:transcriptional regulator with GAF, ATPase, and Fis domain
LLRVLALDGARPRTVMLDEGAVSIGRSGEIAGAPGAPDPELSRLHAIVKIEDEGVTIADQTSRNGTFVDGLRVERARLHDGSVVRVGRTVLVYAEQEVRGDETFELAEGTRLLGDSLALRRVHHEIGLVGRHPVPVLVLGESGVGKERVAEEIHRASGRPGPFVPVNCAAIASQLAESELFGHVAGAFTGASRAADGLFVAADKGTLFLDEVGELPLDLQPKLLRALATGEVRAVGSSVARTVDVRVVAATLRDLGTAVENGTFRSDLFHRLDGWRITMPPLRARREDAIAIGARLLSARRAPPLSADAAEAILLHDWPGNVRELEQMLTAAAIRAAGAPELRLEHLPPNLAQRVASRMPQQDDPARDAQPPSRDELAEMLARFAGNIARVAEHYGKDRQQIYRWVRRYGIDPASFRQQN